MTSILSSIMTLGKIFMIVALFFTVPLCLFPCRDMIYQCFGLQKNNKNHVLLSLVLALSGSILAIFFQNISIYFSLLGGTAGVMKAGGFPAICFYKLKGPRTLNQKLLLIFMAIVTVFAILGAILTVVSWFWLLLISITNIYQRVFLGHFSWTKCLIHPFSPGSMSSWHKGQRFAETGALAVRHSFNLVWVAYYRLEIASLHFGHRL